MHAQAAGSASVALTLALLLPGALLGVLAALPAGTAAAVNESHVVIAVVDTGINPYHLAFRDAGRTAHPGTYLAGFPASATALALCLDDVADPRCAHVSGALQVDAATWSGLQRGRLYTIPGTRIVGAISLGMPGDGFTGPTRLFDEPGHGTASASLAAGGQVQGRNLGACPSCLLVVVEGPGDDALRWARDQPWIDVVTNSWGLVANLDYPPPPFGADGALLTRDMALRGQTVLFSAGNGLGVGLAEPVGSTPDYLVPGESTLTSRYTGPDWVVTVGAVDPENGQPVAGSARPVDLSAAGIDVVAAGAVSRRGLVDFAGTSASAPIAAGVFGQALLEVRRALGDTREGPRDLGLGLREVVAQGLPPAGVPAGAAAADGVVTRDELQRAVYATARPCPMQPGRDCPAEAPADWPFPVRTWGWTHPAPPVAYAAAVGWGMVHAGTAEDAARALLGLDALPVRPEMGAWAYADSMVRQRLWGFWEHGAKPGDVAR